MQVNKVKVKLVNLVFCDAMMIISCEYPTKYHHISTSIIKEGESVASACI